MRFTIALLAVLLASPLHAIDTGDCESTLVHLRTLYELRNLMLKRSTSSYDIEHFIDNRLEQLREPTGDGDYRWVRWVRPAGDGPVEKDAHVVSAVHTRGVDQFESDGAHVYAVRIAVPRKRSLFNSNNPVYVGTVKVRYDNRTKDLTINQWMNPDTSRTIDLELIADRVDVALEAATAERHVKVAIVEVQFRQAVSQDDPANPAYGTVQALKRIRSDADARTIDEEIAEIERELFGGASSLPLLTIISNLRQADELMRSKKEDEQQKGDKLLKDTLARLR